MFSHFLQWLLLFSPHESWGNVGVEGAFVREPISFKVVIGCLLFSNHKSTRYFSIITLICCSGKIILDAPMKLSLSPVPYWDMTSVVLVSTIPAYDSFDRWRTLPKSANEVNVIWARLFLGLLGKKTSLIRWYRQKNVYQMELWPIFYKYADLRIELFWGYSLEDWRGHAYFMFK